MTANTTRRRLLGGCASAGLAALAGCAGSTPFVGRRIEDRETIDPGDASTLSFEGEAGDVTVTGEDRDDLRLDLVKQSSSIRADLEDLVLETDRDDGRLALRSTWEGSEGWFTSRPSMDVDVAIPAALALDRLETSTGRITVRDVETADDLLVSTSTGGTTVRSVDGSVSARASTGLVDVAGVSGTVGADTSTGRVEIRDVGRLADVTTTTGRIAVDVPAIDGDTRLSASTGRVEAAVAPDLDAEVTVRTSTGTLDVGDLPLDDARIEDDRVAGTLGAGGPTLRVETSTGDVTLTTLD